jgi:hypothetical protein
VSGNNTALPGCTASGASPDSSLCDRRGDGLQIPFQIDNGGAACQHAPVVNGHGAANDAGAEVEVGMRFTMIIAAGPN